MRKRRPYLLLAGLLVMSGLATVQAASIGHNFGIPHIRGKVRPGDLAQVQQAFSAGFGSKPLRIDISPGSDDLEVLRIGRWLREQRPAMELRGDCIGSCARYILPAASKLRVRPGIVIALSSFDTWPRHLRRQLDEGALFMANAASQASRQRFLERIAPLIERSHALDEAIGSRDDDIPEPVRHFLDALTAPAGVQQLVFDNERFSLSIDLSRHRCFWWVPDDEGLRQLGLEVTPDYRPPQSAQAARRLKQGAAYIGPALTPLPEQALCGEAAATVPPTPQAPLD